MASLANRSIAEGVGTLLLVYFGAGAAAITLMIANGTKPATPFNIGIGQLGGLGDWFAIGITFGIVIAAVIYALGRVIRCPHQPGRDHRALGYETVPFR